MKAGVLVGHKDIRYTDWPDPVMGDHDVLVGIRIAGICGSDLPRVLGTDVHYYPIVLGHEFAGEVLQVGSAVTRVKVGDRVAGAPLVPCHTCPDCLAGGYGQCDHRTYMGTRIQGGWAERIALPEANAVPVPDELPFEQAALLEPSAVAAHALKVVEYQNGEDVAVVGAGTIGLLVLQWARVNGAKRIVIFSRNSARLELALQLGADVAINPGDPDWLDRVNELTDGRGFGYVFESIGVSSSVRQALQLAARRGRVC